ncbi:MAG: hypothetical protein K2X39_09185, partial [Silvanigrellaceae bacterium]|nr:hypothetical protein [Silvanigrellaceae bacterium]
QISKNAKEGDKKILLVGSQFEIQFDVLVPAMNPPPPVADGRVDSKNSYSGNGQFQQALDPNVTNNS